MLATNLLAARSQMAFTLGFHILLVPFGLCLPLFALIANARGLRHNDRDALRLARRWSQVMGVLFAVGAVTGTVLSFELGVLWPGLMGRFGDVFGLPFAIEGIAFFLEAIFIAIYIFGWDRLPPRLHLWLGAPMPLFALLGAFSIISANSWMNTPRGFELARGRPRDCGRSLGGHPQPCPAPRAHPLRAGRAALRRLRGGVDLCGRDAARAARPPAPPGLPDPVHRRGARHAAADARGRPGGPRGRQAATDQVRGDGARAQDGHPRARAAGRPDAGRRPDGRSSHSGSGLVPDRFHADTRIVGLDTVPPADRPPATIVHLAFDVMVGAASALALLSAWFVLAWLRRRDLPRSHWFLRACAPAGLLPSPRWRRAGS